MAKVGRTSGTLGQEEDGIGGDTMGESRIIRSEEDGQVTRSSKVRSGQVNKLCEMWYNLYRTAGTGHAEALRLPALSSFCNTRRLRLPSSSRHHLRVISLHLSSPGVLESHHIISLHLES